MQHALTMVAGAASGLHYAHEKQGFDGESLDIVHRDVSLSNIVVTYDGGVKLVDFGVAKASERSTAATQAGALKGKLSYMSPEQCLSKPVDRRSDIFSLGVVLYELTTTTRLFKPTQSEGDFRIMERIIYEPVPPPSEVVPDYPPELEAIVMRALAKESDDRQATARELLLEIEQFAAGAALPLSTAGLSSFVTETLGERAEPWRAEELADPSLLQTITTTDDVLGRVLLVGEDGTAITVSPEESRAWTGGLSAAETQAVPGSRNSPRLVVAYRGSLAAQWPSLLVPGVVMALTVDDDVPAAQVDAPEAPSASSAAPTALPTPVVPAPAPAIVSVPVAVPEPGVPETATVSAPTAPRSKRVRSPANNARKPERGNKSKPSSAAATQPAPPTVLDVKDSKSDVVSPPDAPGADRKPDEKQG